MSGAHQFVAWGGAEEDCDDAVFRSGPVSSESDFFSDFFSPMPPVFPNGAPASGSGTAAARGAAADQSRVGVNSVMNEEEVDSSANKSEESKPRRDASAGGSKKKELEAGGSGDHHLKRKRNRTTEMHNMTERRRRDKIKGKLKALQELIPTSHKLDRASLLDEAVAYVKSLQMQVRILSTGAFCHSQCMPASPGACLHMTHFSPLSRMGMAYGMGMGTMGCPVGPPLMSVPSPHAATSYVPMPYNTIPAYCSMSQGLPFAPVPEFVAAMTTSIPSPPALQPGPFTSRREEAAQKPSVCEPTTC